MRHIDADAFKQKLADKDIFFPALYKNELDEMPTADVVPKSEVEQLTVELEAMRTAANSYKMHYEKARVEVAREIFEEIEGSIAVHAFTSKSEDYADGMYDAIEWIDSKIAELKKKYTEDME